MNIKSEKQDLPALSEHSWLRFFVVFLLYVAQGAPIGIFFFAIPAWLATNGANAIEVGVYLSASGLPWTLKFVNGFLMDRFTFLPMGRRRIWLIGAQICMTAALILFAIVDPGPNNIAGLSVFAFIIMVATTYQDVAVDGMAVDLIPDAERARANGLMFGGQSIGIAGGTALTSAAMSAYGFSAAMLGNAGFVAIILVFLSVIRERPGERLLPWTAGATSEHSAAIQVSAWKPLVAQVWTSMINRDSAYLTVAQISSGALSGFFMGAMPLLAVNVAGWTDVEFSQLSGTANLVAGIMGVFLFGFIADKLGSRRAAILLACLFAGLVASFWLAKPFWGLGHTIKTATVVYTCLIVGLQISLCASAMKICSLKVAATQFTLFMALANLGITLSSAALGPLEAIGGYTAILTAIIVAALICAGSMYMFNEKAMKSRVMREDGLAPFA